MDIEEIKIQLEHQSKLIIQVNLSLEFLLNCSKYFQKLSQRTQPRDLAFLYDIIKDATILNVSKLLNSKEDYSLNTISKSVLKKYGKDNLILSFFKNEMKHANKYFSSLGINDIRNKHVAHLDNKRTKMTIDWKEVQKLMEHVCKANYELNQLLLNQQVDWDSDKDLLNSLFIKDKIRRELISEYRDAHRNKVNSIPLEKITKILRINWQ